jgi:hypothetical protein
MFTFGRDHEKKCEARYVRNPADVPMLMNVIDAVHDLIEGRGGLEQLRSSLRVALTDGGAGVWENAAKWLRKTSVEHPEILGLWSELASHPKASVRFRVACYLDAMPFETASAVWACLAQDRSKKVATMAEERFSRARGADAM